MFPENIILEARESFKKHDLQTQKDLIALYASEYTPFPQKKLDMFIQQCLADSRKDPSEQKKPFTHFYAWYYMTQDRPASSPITSIEGLLVEVGPFDNFEIHPMHHVGIGASEPCTSEEAEFWSVFVHTTSIGITCVADAKTKNDACDFINSISMILQAMLNVPNEETLLKKRFTPAQLANAVITFIYIEKKMAWSQKTLDTMPF